MSRKAGIARAHASASPRAHGHPQLERASAGTRTGPGRAG